jgi:murein DD-endopeptidase MepM/ murein hydrolase activator NlpD
MRLPLDSMQIRTADIEGKINNPAIPPKGGRLNETISPLGGTFGKVRSSGQQLHRGWDLYADVGSPAYAIGEGTIVSCQLQDQGQLGRYVVLKLNMKAPTGMLLASRVGSNSLSILYAHLGIVLVSEDDSVSEGAILATTSRSGNARHTPPHLHIQFSTTGTFKKNDFGSIDPVKVFGYEYYQCRVKPDFYPSHWDSFRNSIP